MRDHRESLGPQILQRLRVGGKLPSLRQLQIKHRNIQPSPGADLRILLPQRTRRGISGICHQGLSLQLQLLVDLLKNSASHIHLTPDDQPGQLLRQRHRDRPDGAQVPCHILSHPAIAPGSPLVEYPVAVLQRHRQTVHLRLHTVLCLRQRLPHPVQKIQNLLPVEYILQTLQRNRVHHLRKLVEHRISHPLSRRIRRDLFRVRLFQILQPAVKAVVFIIGHLDASRV